MIWHSENLSFGDQPDGVEVFSVGSAIRRQATLHVKLEIKFKRGNETIAVLWKEKDWKIWPEHAINDITEQDLANKFDTWVQKLNAGDSFKAFIIRAAAKAKPGVVTWLLSLSDIRKVSQ